MGIQSFLIFGDNCRIFLKDMGYFLKKLMGYGILEPPLPGPHKCADITRYQHTYSILHSFLMAEMSF